MAGMTPLTGCGVLIKIVCNIIGTSGDSSILHFDKAILDENSFHSILYDFENLAILRFLCSGVSAVELL